MKHFTKPDKSEIFFLRRKTKLSAKDFGDKFDIPKTVLNNIENCKPVGKDTADKIRKLFGIEVVTSEFVPMKEVWSAATDWNKKHPFRPDLALENFLALYLVLKGNTFAKKLKRKPVETADGPEEWMAQDVSDTNVFMKIKELAREECGRRSISDPEIAKHKNADEYQVVKNYRNLSYVYFFRNGEEVGVVPVLLE